MRRPTADRQEVLRLLRAHREEITRFGVKGIALFGSVARGEQRRTSDVDLLVEFARPVGLFEFIGLKQHLEEVLGARVDLVTPGALRSPARERILGEAVDAA